MEQQFSPGLLYSIAPENFSELHLREETAGFEWEVGETAMSRLADRLLGYFHQPGDKKE